ncbi:MAG TPA: hypothetical protein PKE29_09515 [Phycisphaerales bacterium]|nr:hypothetical protein [Phycisphaerales bacterium]
MKRAKKRGSRGAGVVGPGAPLVIGGVTPGSTRRPPGSSRAAAGRLGRALSAARKKSASRAAPSAPAAKAPARGGSKRTPKPRAGRGPGPERAAKRSASASRKSARSTPLLADRSERRSANARVKKSQIKRAGLESRLLGHVSGMGRRRQARRDSKNG